MIVRGRGYNIFRLTWQVSWEAVWNTCLYVCVYDVWVRENHSVSHPYSTQWRNQIISISQVFISWVCLEEKQRVRKKKANGKWNRIGWWEIYQFLWLTSTMEAWRWCCLWKYKWNYSWNPVIVYTYRFTLMFVLLLYFLLSSFLVILFSHFPYPAV